MKTVQQMLTEWREYEDTLLKSNCADQPTETREEGSHHWQPPQQGFLKINVATKNNLTSGQTGIGAVGKNW